MKFFFRTRVLAIAGLLIVLSPSVAHAETWKFAWSHGGQSGTHTFSSETECNNARDQWVRAMRGMGESGRAGSCGRIGGGSGSSSRPSTGATAKPNPPSGPTADEVRKLNESRQREYELAARNARQRELDRQREHEAGKAKLLEQLDGPDTEIIVGQDISWTESPATHQLVCSASRTRKAIDLYYAGDYQTAIRLSRASVGEAQSTGECTVAGIKIPDAPDPVEEIDFVQGMNRFQETDEEITETIQVLATARMDMDKAKESTARRESQLERQEALVVRLENAPDGAGKEEGLDKANALMAKARAMLAEAKSAEDAADERLRELGEKRERLCALGNDLSKTLNQEKIDCQKENS